MTARNTHHEGTPLRATARPRIGFALAMLFAVGAGLHAAVAAAPTSSAGGDPVVRIERGRMSADVTAVPVVAVLTEVARRTGAVVLVRGELGDARPQSFTDAPIREGLERLVAPNHLVVEFAPSASGVATRITRIRVFGAGADVERTIEPQQIGPGTPAPTDAAAARSAVTPFDGKLGWAYGDGSTLPPLALRVRKIGTIFPSSGDEGVNALGDVVENDPDPQVRAAALRALAQFDGESGYPLIQAALADRDAEVRLAAINAVDTMANQPSAMLLELVVNDSEEQRLRLAGLERLAPYRDRDEVREVLEELQNTNDGRVRSAAKALLQE
jgi:HEAT repeat.